MRFQSLGTAAILVAILPDDELIDPGDAEVLIFGMGRIGKVAYDNMRERYGRHVLGLDYDRDVVQKNRADGREVIQDDATDSDLWEKIRSEYLHSGLGVVGLDDVLMAAKAGRVEKMIVNRTFKPLGRRCRSCETLDPAAVDTCSVCGSQSLFEVDVVNEIVEMLKLSGAEADFADSIQTLADAGDIAALLRYRA